MGVELGGWSFGAQFGDLNNDGKLDLYLTNGYVSADREQDLLVRLRQSVRRQRGHHFRRGQLARHRQSQPLRVSVQARVAQRRRGQVHGRGAAGGRDGHAMTGAQSPWPICGTRAHSMSSSPTSAAPCSLQEHSHARKPVAGIRSERVKGQRSGDGASDRRLLLQRFRDWGASPFNVERADAASGSAGRQRLLRPKPAPPAFRAGQKPEIGKGRYPLAVRQNPNSYYDDNARPRSGQNDCGQRTVEDCLNGDASDEMMDYDSQAQL